MDQLLRSFGDVIVGVLVGFPVMVLVVAGLVLARKRRLGLRGALRRSVLDGLVLCAVLPVLYLVLVPVPMSRTPVSLVPGADVLSVDDGAAVWQLVGNLVMLAPLGAVTPLRWPGMWSRVTIVVCAVAVAVGIEGAQWVLQVGRVVSTDDVLVNTVGAVVAALLIRPWWSRWGIVARRNPLRRVAGDHAGAS